MWATSDSDATFQFAQPAPRPQERRVKNLMVVSVVLLPVTIALYYLLPPSPAAALAVGLLWGIGASIPIGCLLAIWTTPKPTTVEVGRFTQDRTKPFVICDDSGSYILFYPDGREPIFMTGEQAFLLGLPGATEAGPVPGQEGGV